MQLITITRCVLGGNVCTYIRRLVKGFHNGLFCGSCLSHKPPTENSLRNASRMKNKLGRGDMR